MGIAKVCVRILRNERTNYMKVNGQEIGEKKQRKYAKVLYVFLYFLFTKRLLKVTVTLQLQLHRNKFV